MNKKKKILLFACIALVAALLAVGTYALLTAQTGSVENTFSSDATTGLEVKETFDGNTKSDVYVTVNGDIASYIRANVVITMQDADGNTVPAVPVENTDYTISFGSDWQKVGDYYYYKGAITNGDTTNLINTATTLDSTYKLNIDVAAQSIQSTGDFVKDAWGVEYVGGSWQEVAE